MSTFTDIAALRHDNKTRCPNCSTAFTGSLSRAGNSFYQLQLQPIETGESWKLTMLYRTLHGYFRWVAEGKKPHGCVVTKEHPFGKPGAGQYYYDPYHDHVEYLPEEDLYRFSIQTSDSDTGDTWWSGKFRLWGAAQIKEIFDEEVRNL